MKNFSIKGLERGFVRTGGRNNQGRLTAYHRGGGYKRKTYFLDYFRTIWNLSARVRFLFKNTFKTYFLMLVCYENGYFLYQIAPENINIHDFIFSGNFIGNILGANTILGDVPTGTFFFNLQNNINKISSSIRSAGTFGQILSKIFFKKNVLYCLVKLPSGQLKYFLAATKVTLGLVSNSLWKYKKLKKAGQNRLLGKRPVVRGVAKNPVDHPMGGGEGKSSGGRSSVTPWGVLTKGYKTKRSNFSKFLFVE